VALHFDNFFYYLSELKYILVSFSMHFVTITKILLARIIDENMCS